MNESWFSVHRADGRLHVSWVVGERFADVNVMNKLSSHSGR